MPRVCTLLVFLLVILTFNAYACVLPLPTSTQVDRPSSTEEQPARQTCDAFLEIGPQSEHSSNEFGSIIHIDSHIPAKVPHLILSASLPSQPPRDPDTSIHSSIPTTVLRI
jgi:hypothetical protein